MEVLDGAITEEKATQLKAKKVPSITMEQYIALRNTVLGDKMKDRHPSELREYTPPKAAGPRGLGHRGPKVPTAAPLDYATVVKGGEQPQLNKTSSTGPQRRNKV
jgi:hypothetical protein